MEIQFYFQHAQKIEKAIRNVGVEEGDILLVHSDITPVIKLADLKRWKKKALQRKLSCAGI